MRQDISLWCPVIIAGLPAPRTCRREYQYDLGEGYDRIDDIRIKTQRATAIGQGKYVQALIQLEAVILLEDRCGNTGVLSRTAHISERVDWAGINGDRLIGAGISYILQIQSLDWDAVILEGEIEIRYTIYYTVHAVREQAVRIHLGKDECEPTAIRNECRWEVQDELSKILIENQALNRRLVFYQKDMLSLQHGIKKAEGRNAQLCRELNRTREKMQQLQEAVTRKDMLITRYHQNVPTPRPDRVIPYPSKSKESGWGQRIKRLLLSCL